jgi:hypothetical protein
MKAAFGLRFLPAFFAFFFAISVSPLDVPWKLLSLKRLNARKIGPGSPAAEAAVT